MKLTKSQKKIQDRRSVVYQAYLSDDCDSVQQTVEKMAKKYGVSTVTIYGDIKAMKKEVENG